MNASELCECAKVLLRAEYYAGVPLKVEDFTEDSAFLC